MDKDAKQILELVQSLEVVPALVRDIDRVLAGTWQRPRILAVLHDLVETGYLRQIKWSGSNGSEPAWELCDRGN